MAAKPILADAPGIADLFPDVGSESQLFTTTRDSNLVRLRTLVLVRWMAIIGQAGAVCVAVGLFHLRIAVGPVAIAIGLSLAVNVLSTVLFPQSTRLSARQAMSFLMLDIVQLGMLLYLVGGLNNPFALLIMAPVTIGAAVLTRRGTLLLAGLAIVVISLLRVFYVPMVLADGSTLEMPDIFLFGFWLALIVGVIFLSVYARQITLELQKINEALLATQMALAREQKLTDLGGVVAAAAHELGTPLATIKLVAAELVRDLDGQPDLRDDAALLLDQANRCRDILHSMGRAGKEDRLLLRAPLEALLHEAAEPHLARGKEVVFLVADDVEASAGPQPTVLRRPEVIHGLRNLIQNAVDFAQTTVRVEYYWDPTTLRVRICDDGEGFPPSVIGRIGDPFVHRRRPTENAARRPGYEGMGLGLFIAKTLLERSGGRPSFSNAVPDVDDPDHGAVVTVSWPRALLEAPPLDAIDGFGENRPFWTGA
ncbi:two-component system, sensor histidine kinase RegB [Ketogulonicigenium robustum]|uniref:histidine kinase n=1 Tax=Ketogulonicigenium robustum TaxID=92947 RepID=A0A1W6P2L2_9RHOB|nr:ActS/PrrB/RegB family redox-sensitive histidine kinase [Ketogulonicigenium robustum]ARO15716.1 two-component system, sensor histidine kinase RegB [Ketogulonicigenium robustum]